MGVKDEVKHVSISLVKPWSHKEVANERVELGPSDLRCLRRPHGQRGLFFTYPKQENKLYFRQDHHETVNHIINHLKNSLSRTLDYFFPLAGRLSITEHKEDDTVSFYINCNSAGAEFIHATADITMNDILTKTHVPQIVNSFFSLNGVRNYEESRPLLSVQVTQLNDGIFIACSLNHVAGDGTSFWHFFNSWSEISKGSDNISLLPVFKHWFPDINDCPIHLPSSTLQQFLLKKEINPITDAFEQKVFYFLTDNITKLKAIANSQSLSYGDNVNSSITISSLQAMLGHVWAAVTRARRLDPEEEISCSLAIGTRCRFDPPLPNGYFGNSVVTGYAKAKAGELVQKGPSWGSLLLNQMVNSYNDKTIRSYWKTWMDEPVMLSIDEVVSSVNLRAGSSPRFNMYGTDFGWGPPIAMRGGGSYKFKGRISVIPGPVEGVIGIEACLPLETFQAMEADANFMEVVTEFPHLQSVNC